MTSMTAATVARNHTWMGLHAVVLHVARFGAPRRWAYCAAFDRQAVRRGLGCETANRLRIPPGRVMAQVCYPTKRLMQRSRRLAGHRKERLPDARCAGTGDDVAGWPGIEDAASMEYDDAVGAFDLVHQVRRQSTPTDRSRHSSRHESRSCRRDAGSRPTVASSMRSTLGSWTTRGRAPPGGGCRRSESGRGRPRARPARVVSARPRSVRGGELGTCRASGR